MSKPGPKGPWKYDKNFHPHNFIELSRSGNCLAEIAADWDINRDTIREWAEKHAEFSVAIKKGKELCEAWYINFGRAAMVGQAKSKDGKPIKVELGFFVWMTKNVCKWSDRIDQKNDINIKDKSYAKLSNKEKLKRIERARAALIELIRQENESQ